MVLNIVPGASFESAQKMKSELMAVLIRNIRTADLFERPRRRFEGCIREERLEPEPCNVRDDASKAAPWRGPRRNTYYGYLV